MSNPISGKNILLGITGSIAGYKAADLASKLTQDGAIVHVILTQAALQFVTPLTFQSVTGQRAFCDADLWGGEGHVRHIGLGQIGDLFIIAPASANTLAKLAHGIADNLLTVTALAARCPLMVAPAMDGGMFSHPATQENLEILRHRGVHIIGPAEGRMASGLLGAGRMVEPAELLGWMRLELGRNGLLKGRKVVVTAGGTSEPIDPVRYITNRSSGKQGFALAQAALDAGAQVTLIAGSTALPTPIGANRVDVESAQHMLEAVLNAIPGADALIMAAAVADFQPKQSANQKLKKEQGLPAIEWQFTPDILMAVAAYKKEHGTPGVVIGFAAESRDIIANARKKLATKDLDLIAANDITAQDAGFAVDTNRITLLDRQGKVESLPFATKTILAETIMERLAALLPEHHVD